MTKDYSRIFKLENEPSKFVESPVVRKKFRVTIDVGATLASGPHGGMLPPLRRTCTTPRHLRSDCWSNLSRRGTLDTPLIPGERKLCGSHLAYYSDFEPDS